MSAMSRSKRCSCGSASILAFFKMSKPDRKSTRLNSSHRCTSYDVFCLKKESHVAMDNLERVSNTHEMEGYCALVAQIVFSYSLNPQETHRPPETIAPISIAPRVFFHFV